LTDNLSLDFETEEAEKEAELFSSSCLYLPLKLSSSRKPENHFKDSRKRKNPFKDSRKPEKKDSSKKIQKEYSFTENLIIDLDSLKSMLVEEAEKETELLSSGCLPGLSPVSVKPVEISFKSNESSWKPVIMERISNKILSLCQELSSSLHLKIIII